MRRQRSATFAAWAVFLAGGLGLTGGPVWGAAVERTVEAPIWAGMKGTLNLGLAPVYGTQGVPDPANRPGNRFAAVSWTSPSGKRWLFGGEGYASSGRGLLNDLWQYDPATGDWTWMKGPAIFNQVGAYGTQRAAAPANMPGARMGATSWTDPSGKLWLFGGDGYASSGRGPLNDLWQYDPATGHWTWMNGASTVGQPGRYGTQGTAAPDNTPGARFSAVSWVGASGNLWLFGGQDQSQAGAWSPGAFNDLWQCDPATGHWTWMKGASTVNQAGRYGTQGTAAPDNTPGARNSSVSWTDSSGKLWLFGGNGHASSGTGCLNDLWRYDPLTGHWAWIKGASTAGQYGSYGTPGIPAAANLPGARHSAVSWTDGVGKLWLFGGYGCASSGIGALNDLWRYDPATGHWAWMTGASRANQYGNYGTRGTPATPNTPGGRYNAVCWTEGTDKLWLVGGYGYASSGNGHLNDLWRYDLATGHWTWMKGDFALSQPGSYGTPGTPAPANSPGARERAVSWTDGPGSLWLFGGSGNASAGHGYLNDLWRYDPAAGNWAWMKGASTTNQYGTYGTQGTAAAANTPGARERAVSWTDNSGRLWLFGGYGNGASGCGHLNDLWRYDPATGNWTWIRGASTVNQPGTYGTQGVPAADNMPGARHNAVSWTDGSGRLWLFGGKGYDDSSVSGHLNDLWQYDPATGCWTWMKGASMANQSGTYGVPGTPAPANSPGARERAVAWTDGLGRLWLFGGSGYAASSNGYLNDLWQYDPVPGHWTWMKGASTVNQRGTYGALGTPAPANSPGARERAVAWTDGSGRLWLFGGLGYAASGRAWLNDLWRYDPFPGVWTWVKGASTVNQPGSCGIPGTPDPANAPGARHYAVSWADRSGRLWLFGGYGYDCSGYETTLGDLWMAPVTDLDTTAPVITLLGGTPVTVECGGAYADAGATASDDTDGDLTRSIVVTNPVRTGMPGMYTVRYNVRDAANNRAAEVARSVHVADPAVPVISLLGAADVVLDCGQVYADAGARANDACWGDLTGAIFTSGLPPGAPLGPGSWVITYDVLDGSGDSSVTVRRTVTVRDNCTLTVNAAGDTLVQSRLGRRVELSVVAVGAVNPVSYQWRKGDASRGGKAFDLLPGATGATLVISPVAAESEGLYVCSVSDAVATVDGPAFTLVPSVERVDGAGPFGLATAAAALGLGGVSILRRWRR